MKLIPVIDLMHGRVVTARQGQRDGYLPSDTPLCPSSQPQAVLSAFLELHPFSVFYIADLDAIRGEGNHSDLIRRLSLDHPELVFWVDNGLTDLDRVCEFARPVIGTESLDDCEQLAHLNASLTSPILSLDYLDERFNGPDGLDRKPAFWPEDVIIMTLARVGTRAGPDLIRMQQLQRRSPGIRFHAAGGIRDLQDLERLRSIGAAGALLSTALHQKAIGAAAIGRFLNP